MYRIKTRIDMTSSANAPLISWRGAMLALLLAVPLCWPMLVAGGIYTFPDTRSYLKGGELIWQIVGQFVDSLGADTSAVPQDAAPHPSVARSLGSAASDDDSGPIVVVRSIAYSFFSYSLYFVGGAMLISIAQGALVVFFLFSFLDPIQKYNAPTFFIGFSIVGIATSLPWFTVYIMPDIFAAIVLLHGALLIRRFDDLTRTQQFMMTLIASFATASHYGNPPLALGLFSVAVAWRLLSRRWSMPVLIAALFPVLLSPIANLTISAAALEKPSAAPLRLPILLARSLEDGPARWYLEEACPGAGFAICELFDEDPPESVSEFLWSEQGIAGASRETVSRIRDEEIPVLLRAFIAYPVEQAVSLLRNAALQLVRFRIVGFQLAGGLDSDFRRIAPEKGSQDSALKQLAGSSNIAITIASIGVFIFALFMGYARMERLEIIAMLMLGLFLNALIFGGLSYPADRYQARLIWLLPAFAVIFLAKRRPVLSQEP